jgi:hypothetical protein
MLSVDAGGMTISETTTTRSPLTWVLIPAVVMSLGWGLRGYIGGGPFGAMIPGALVMLMICSYLGYSARAAAVVVAFGTFGVGFGGLMTYGQTLGLLRADETFAWGLTGTTLKGSVWGLLGGAVIGLGFASRHIPQRHVVVAFLFMLVGVIVGIHEINAPKLIYFPIRSTNRAMSHGPGCCSAHLPCWDTCGSLRRHWSGFRRDLRCTD